MTNEQILEDAISVGLLHIPESHKGKPLEQPTYGTMLKLAKFAELTKARAIAEAEYKCNHYKTDAYYDHVLCTDCGSVLTDGDWGIASSQWFDSLDIAKFYKKNGYLPLPPNAQQERN